jgi:hypothetical protein
MTPLSKALRGYTQESARHAIESKTVGYLAELRRVTTIFINISGLEEHLLQGALFYVQQVRASHSLCSVHACTHTLQSLNIYILL